MRHDNLLKLITDIFEEDPYKSAGSIFSAAYSMMYTWRHWRTSTPNGMLLSQRCLGSSKDYQWTR